VRGTVFFSPAEVPVRRLMALMESLQCAVEEPPVSLSLASPVEPEILAVHMLCLSMLSTQVGSVQMKVANTADGNLGMG